MANIKPIETYYNGYRFRSRLEARWAVLFDALNIQYEYEAEGYYLPNGEKYLPDFVLHGGSYRCPDPLFVEVKGQMTKKDAAKIRIFAGLCPEHEYVNTCEDCKYLKIQMDFDHKGYSYEATCGIDISYNGDFVVGLYPDYQHYHQPKNDNGNPIYLVTNIPANIREIANGIDVEGLNVSYYNFKTVDGDYFGAVLGACKNGGWGLFGADSTYWANMDQTKTQAAYEKARYARFEYGETPKIQRHISRKQQAKNATIKAQREGIPITIVE